MTESRIEGGSVPTLPDDGWLTTLLRMDENGGKVESSGVVAGALKKTLDAIVAQRR